MHDPDNTTRVLGFVGLGFVGVTAVVGVAAYLLATGERREARRRSIHKNLRENGWFWLSYTLKNVGFAFPRAEQHLTWLLFPSLILAGLALLMRPLRWFIRGRKRTRLVETTYTRALRAESRKKSDGRLPRFRGRAR